MVKVLVMSAAVAGFMALAGFRAFSPHEEVHAVVIRVRSRSTGASSVVRLWQVPTKAEADRINHEIADRLNHGEAVTAVIAWVDGEVGRETGR